MKWFLPGAGIALRLVGIALVGFVWIAPSSSREPPPATAAGNPVSSDAGDTFGYRVTDARYRPGCERSGGTWYERKGRDLPMVLCECPYNDWLNANRDKVVSSGCECNSSCFALDAAFPPFDFAGELQKPKPARSSTKVILRTDLSRCSFPAMIDNRCAECREDADCGGHRSGGSSLWIQYSTVSVCDDGRCRYRRTIYYE